MIQAPTVGPVALCETSGGVLTGDESHGCSDDCERDGGEGDGEGEGGGAMWEVHC